MTPDATTPASADPTAQAAPAHPWLQSYPAGIKWDAEIAPSTMVQMFDDAVKKFGDRTCLNFLGAKMTYNEVNAAAERFAKGLQDQGIGKDNHVGLCLPNSPFHVIAYYGALKAGATLVNFNPLYAEKEMAHLIDDSKCDVMVTFNNKMLQAKLDKMLGGATHLQKTIIGDIADILPPGKSIMLRTRNVAKAAMGKLKPLIEKLPGDVKIPKPKEGEKPKKLKGFAKFKKTLLDFGNTDSFKVKEDASHVAFSTMLKSTGDLKPVETSPDDVALLQYTGGTTGVPKAVMLTHANLTANIAQSDAWFTGGEKKDDAKQGKMLAVLPFFHVFAMTVQENLSLKLGAELVMLPKPDVGEIMKTIDREKPTMFAGVPSIYETMMIATPPKPGKLTALFNKLVHRKPRTEYDVSSVNMWLTGGAATPETLETAWLQHTGKHFTKGYGLSETSPLAIAMPLTQDVAGSIGLPVPGTEVRITSIEKAPDISDKVLAQGENGEICLRGPQVMKGYWNRPDETALVMDKDGFFHTGDTGYIDEKGYVFITGRLKDMINRQGLKVFPLKVEAAMLQHPAIAEVCVVGVPDPRVQEEVKAHIVFKEGQKASPEELKKFLQERLAPYEIPHLWKIRDSLPKTPIGKPDKKVLKAEDEAELEAKAAAPAARKP